MRIEHVELCFNGQICQFSFERTALNYARELGLAHFIIRTTSGYIIHSQ